MSANYFAYVLERKGMKTMRSAHGFVIYKTDENGSTFIEDCYVAPKFRKRSEATTMLDELAEKENSKQFVTQVFLGTNGAEESMLAQLHYGFRLFSAQGNVITLVKPLGGNDGK